MAEHIVRPVEPPTLVVIDQGLDVIVRSHARQSAAISLTEDQSALQVEGRAVAADCGPDQLGFFAWYQTKQLVAAKIDKYQ